MLESLYSVHFAQFWENENCGIDSETQQWCAIETETDFRMINIDENGEKIFFGNVTINPVK